MASGIFGVDCRDREWTWENRVTDAMTSGVVKVIEVAAGTIAEGRPRSVEGDVRRLHPPSGKRSESPYVAFYSYFGELLLCLMLLLAGSGCRSVAPLPKVNLEEPGWAVRQGQAVWRLDHGTQEIAGDVMVATGPDDRSLVQFSKSPFPLVIAQSSARQWEVEFPPQNKHYAGHGTPPLRVIWLYLPRVLEGKPPPKGWVWRQDNTQWHLENPASGESLEGYFNS